MKKELIILSTILALGGCDASIDVEGYGVVDPDPMYVSIEYIDMHPDYVYRHPEYVRYHPEYHNTTTIHNTTTQVHNTVSPTPVTHNTPSHGGVVPPRQIPARPPIKHCPPNRPNC